MGNTQALEYPLAPVTSEDIVIMSGVKEISKLFIKESVIVRYDPNVFTEENKSYSDDLRTVCDVKSFDKWEEAVKYINQSGVCCQVMTSGTNGEAFVKEIADAPNVSNIYVFCGNVAYHSQWANSYPKVAFVIHKFPSVWARIEKDLILWQKDKSSLRVDLPAFVPIFDDKDKSDHNKLQLKLKGLVNFKNREQSKKDFIALAREIYDHDRDYIDEFEKSYNDYSMKSTFTWYTMECFFYKLTNNCLRIATSDSIQYCRLVVKDLDTAIKERYREQSKNFSGILYRAAYMSEPEWQTLQQNKGKDIEMHGFLSTSKVKTIALRFSQTDIEKKALITIVVPSAPDRGEQGFAEVKEFSVFEREDEVIFNIMSRFTILEGTIEQIGGQPFRHLILLYGTQAMKRYTKVTNPSVNIQIIKPNDLKCKVCNSKISVARDSLIYVDISNKGRYVCKGCVKKYNTTQSSPLLCVAPQVHNFHKVSELNLKLEGFMMQYPQGLDLPFYGYRCVKCNGDKLSSCYTCVKCQDVRKKYCENCFNYHNECVQSGHFVVLESQPFTFWSEKMSDKELQHWDYINNISSGQGLFQQASTFYRTQDYEKAAKFYEKYLEQIREGEETNKNVATSLNNLGVIFTNLGQYEKALEYMSKALNVMQLIYGDQHRNVAITFNNLGSAYERLEKYEKATGCYSSALEIYKSMYGDDHEEIGISYNNLGSLFNKLGLYEKAVEYHLLALRILNSVCGDKHPETAIAYNNLGSAYNKLGKCGEAMEFHSKALESWKLIHGDKHPNTLTSYNNLGSVYENLGRDDKAVECYLKGLEIHKLINGEKSRDYAVLNDNIGLLYRRLNKFEIATQYHLKALEILTSIYGNEHIEIVATCINLESAYKKLDQHAKANEYRAKAEAIKKESYVAIQQSNSLETAQRLSYQMQKSEDKDTSFNK